MMTFLLAAASVQLASDVPHVERLMLLAKVDCDENRGPHLRGKTVRSWLLDKLPAAEPAV